MSFPGNIPNATPNQGILLTGNQQSPAQQSTTTGHIIENALGQSTTTNTPPLTTSPIPNPVAASMIQAIVQTILIPGSARPPLQDVLNQWAGNDDNKIEKVALILECTRNQSSRLNLSFSNLTSLPDVFGYPELSHIAELFLYDNQLTALPDSISQLTALRVLTLKNNQLTTLPESIGQLTALQILGLEGNQLTTLPESIGQLTALRILSLEGNQLTTLPESIGQLTALHGLSLDGNQLTTLPESIGQLTALQGLSLDGNQLTTLPESIGQL
ncbi:MAG: leucine-rich repeat domain-containing protein, partial [Chlamydiota bacterium]